MKGGFEGRRRLSRRTSSSEARNISNWKNSKEEYADITFFDERAQLWHRGKIFSCLRWGGVQEWSQTYWSYGDVVSRGQMAGERLITAEWFGLIGSEPLHWGQLLRGQNDDQFRDQTIRLPAGKPRPLIIPLRKCFSFCIPQSSFTFISSLVLLFQASSFPSASLIPPFSHSPLCVASHASGCWIIDRMLS